MAQKLIEIDTSTVIFKAKLLTLSRYGISNERSILRDISSQDLEFLETGSNNIILMKISFNQRYYLGDTLRHLAWIGSCNFYVAYNVNKYSFYRIGGFKSNDAEDFIKDLNPEDYVIFDIDRAERIDFDFYCILEYSKIKKRKKKRKKFDCLGSCYDELDTKMVIENQR